MNDEKTKLLIQTFSKDHSGIVQTNDKASGKENLFPRITEDELTKIMSIATSHNFEKDNTLVKFKKGPEIENQITFYAEKIGEQLKIYVMLQSKIVDSDGNIIKLDYNEKNYINVIQKGTFKKYSDCIELTIDKTESKEEPESTTKNPVLTDIQLHGCLISLKENSKYEHSEEIKHEIGLQKVLNPELTIKEVESEVDGKYFTIVKKAKYGSMIDYLNKEPKPDLNTILKLYGQVIQQVKEMHAMGICHNDIKPENILIFEDENGHPYARLTDFGTVQIIGEVKKTALGTPYYMPAICKSPIMKRMIINEHTQDPILFRALTDKKPDAYFEQKENLLASTVQDNWGLTVCIDTIIRKHFNKDKNSEKMLDEIVKILMDSYESFDDDNNLEKLIIAINQPHSTKYQKNSEKSEQLSKLLSENTDKINMQYITSTAKEIIIEQIKNISMKKIEGLRNKSAKEFSDLHNEISTLLECTNKDQFQKQALVIINKIKNISDLDNPNLDQEIINLKHLAFEIGILIFNIIEYKNNNSENQKFYNETLKDLEQSISGLKEQNLTFKEIHDARWKNETIDDESIKKNNLLDFVKQNFKELTEKHQPEKTGENFSENDLDNMCFLLCQKVFSGNPKKNTIQALPFFINGIELEKLDSSKKIDYLDLQKWLIPYLEKKLITKPNTNIKKVLTESPDSLLQVIMLSDKSFSNENRNECLSIVQELIDEKNNDEHTTHKSDKGLTSKHTISTNTEKQMQPKNDSSNLHGEHNPTKNGVDQVMAEKAESLRKIVKNEDDDDDSFSSSSFHLIHELETLNNTLNETVKGSYVTRLKQQSKKNGTINTIVDKLNNASDKLNHALDALNHDSEKPYFIDLSQEENLSVLLNNLENYCDTQDPSSFIYGKDGSIKNMIKKYQELIKKLKSIEALEKSRSMLPSGDQEKVKYANVLQELLGKSPTGINAKTAMIAQPVKPTTSTNDEANPSSLVTSPSPQDLRTTTPLNHTEQKMQHDNHVNLETIITNAYKKLYGIINIKAEPEIKTTDDFFKYVYDNKTEIIFALYNDKKEKELYDSLNELYNECLIVGNNDSILDEKEGFFTVLCIDVHNKAKNENEEAIDVLDTEKWMKHKANNGTKIPTTDFNMKHYNNEYIQLIKTTIESHASHQQPISIKANDQITFIEYKHETKNDSYETELTSEEEPNFTGSGLTFALKKIENVKNIEMLEKIEPIKPLTPIEPIEPIEPIKINKVTEKTFDNAAITAGKLGTTIEALPDGYTTEKSIDNVKAEEKFFEYLKDLTDKNDQLKSKMAEIFKILTKTAESSGEIKLDLSEVYDKHQKDMPALLKILYQNLSTNDSIKENVITELNGINDILKEIVIEIKNSSGITPDNYKLMFPENNSFLSNVANLFNTGNRQTKIVGKQDTKDTILEQIQATHGKGFDHATGYPIVLWKGNETQYTCVIHEAIAQSTTTTTTGTHTETTTTTVSGITFGKLPDTPTLNTEAYTSFAREFLALHKTDLKNGNLAISISGTVDIATFLMQVHAFSDALDADDLNKIKFNTKGLKIKEFATNDDKSVKQFLNLCTTMKIDFPKGLVDKLLKSDNDILKAIGLQMLSPDDTRRAEYKVAITASAIDLISNLEGNNLKELNSILQREDFNLNNKITEFNEAIKDKKDLVIDKDSKTGLIKKFGDRELGYRDNPTNRVGVIRP